jgi:hypothetical protein
MTSERKIESAFEKLCLAMHEYEAESGRTIQFFLSNGAPMILDYDLHNAEDNLSPVDEGGCVLIKLAAKHGASFDGGD